MRRALVLAYYFPPIGGAGAQRPAKLVRYLPTYGIEPVVVTGSGASIGRWTPADETLNDEVAPSTEVHRLTGKEPVAATGWRRRVERWLGVRPKWASWWVDGVVDLGRQVEDIDLIYSWMSPYESAVAAAQLSEELGKPWVADLGDPWALDEMMMFPTAFHRSRELQRMRRLLGSAAAIVMSTPEAALRVRQTFPELAGKPIVSIPNGFDASDFEGSVLERDDGVFRIVHTGYLHTELGKRQRRTAGLRRLLGGETRGVDILTRSHVYLLEAIDRLIERDPSLRDRIEVHLAGVLSSTDREIAGRSEVVRLHGYLPHAESIQLIRSADLLFLPMQNLPAGTRSSTVPGKTYEYIASGRPILAAIPDGDAHDILTDRGESVCRPDDIEAMMEIVGKHAHGSVNGSGPIVEAPERFEYRRLARSLADIFKRMLAVQEAPARVRSVATAEAPGATNGKGRHRPESLRKIIHLAYYFPPIGGAGAQRTLKFIRYLPLFGYESLVIAGPGETGGRWTPADDTLTSEVSAETEVRRVTGPEPVLAKGWRARGERWLRILPEWSRWWITGAEEVGRGIDDVEAIYVSMSPYESAVAGARLSEELGKPWVAGLRDPWALDEMMMFPTAFHRWRELRQMRRVLRSAAAIVMTTPEATTRIRQTFPELAAKPIVSIPNGFDASDFEGSVLERDDGVFRIVHTGYLHTELGKRQRRTAGLRRLLGGETRGVDILTRSHVYLLEAIDRLIERDPSLRDRIEVHLAGVLSSTDREIAGRSEVVRLHGYLPHAESIQLIRSADLLFLPMQNLPAGTRSSTVPGKTYEYIASGRPILAAIPDGDAHDILTAVGTARFAAPADSAAIADAIAEELERWRTGGEPPQPAWDVVARYERQLITEQLAAVFDAVTALPTTGRSRTSEAAELAVRVP